MNQVQFISTKLLLNDVITSITGPFSCLVNNAQALRHFMQINLQTNIIRDFQLQLTNFLSSFYLGQNLAV